MSLVLFSATLCAVIIDGVGFDFLPVLIEEHWPHHIAAFALLVFSARLAFARTLMFWTVLYSLLLALLIELLQGLIPNHGMSLVHIGANIAGVLLGWGVALLWRRQMILRQAAGDV